MVAILLFVAIIIFASFFGVYKKEDFRTVNIIKDYKLGMQFTNTVVLNYKPTTEEKEVIYNAEGDVVIDPCCGSGTTLRASYELGRSAYGFEIDRNFYQRARDEMIKDCKEVVR